MLSGYTTPTRGLLLACLGMLVCLGIPRIGAAQDAFSGPTLDDMRLDVAYLSADLLEGRATGSVGAELAARYIADRFEEVGLTPGGDGGWFRSFQFRYSENPHAPDSLGEDRSGRNVIGLLDYGAPRSVVIGAHYDHLGYGMSGSLQPGDSLIHNGADDNASGVAAVIEIVRRLRDSEARRNNIIIVAFSGEELGLIGSKHFVDDSPVPIDQINYMINLDMVGRLGPDRRLAVNGTGTSPAWDAALQAAADEVDLTLAKHASGLGPSDHASFYLRDVPVLHLFTGQHADYHKPSDDSHLIDYRGLQDVARFTVEIIEVLDDDGALEFSKTDDEGQSRQVSFDVSLGIMPDYVYDGVGLRIDAVLDGRAADRAGLQDGDILLRLGDVEISDIYAYMEALSALEGGDVRTVTIRRGEEVLEKEVRF